MPEVILKNLPFLLSGLRLTAEIALWSIVGGTALGLAHRRGAPLRVPVLAQLVALYVGSSAARRCWSCCSSAISACRRCSATRPAPTAPRCFGFILFIAAYLAEDFRTGLRSVRPAWCRPALATGLTRGAGAAPDRPAAGGAQRDPVAVQPVCAPDQVHLGRLGDRRQRIDRSGLLVNAPRLPAGDDPRDDRHRFISSCARRCRSAGRRSTRIGVRT